MEIVAPKLTRRQLIKAGIAAGATAAGVAGGLQLLTSENSPTVPAGIEITNIQGVQVLRSKTEGPPIIFLHNSAQVPLGMTEHIGNLSAVGTVVAPNIFDIVRALQLKGNKNPDFADVVNYFWTLDILKPVQKVGLVSSSLGGSFAWEYAAQNLNNVDWIVAGSPTGWPLKRSLSEWIAAFVREFILPAKNPIPAEIKRKDPGPGMFFARLRQHPPSVIQSWKMTRDIDQREQMSSLTLPVDLLWGATDRYIPVWAGEEMANIMLNGRLYLVSPYNHTWMIEAEKLTNPAVARAKANRGK